MDEVLNQSDIFIELLDSEGASLFFDKFKISIPGFRTKNASLKQKKDQLKKLFKGSGGSIKRGKANGNYYFRAINMLSNHYFLNDEKLKQISDKEILFYFSIMKKTPDYAKWAYLLVNRIELANELELDFSNKLLDQKHVPTSIFNYDETLTSEEEAIEVAKAIIKRPIESLIPIAKKSFSENQQEDYLTLVQELVELPYHKFLAQRTDLYNRFTKNFVNAVYGIEKKELDEEIRINLLIGLIDEQLRLPSSNSANIESEISELEAQMELFQSKVEKLSKERNLLIREQKKRESDIETLRISLETERTQNARVEALHEDEIIKLNKKHEFEMKKEIESKQVLSKQVRNILEKVEHWAGERELIKEFAIIYTCKSNLLVELYPEIIAFPLNDWESNKEEILSASSVYLQRNDVDTRDILKVERAVKRANKRFQVFIADDEKALIEKIELIKQKLEVEKNGI